MKKFSIVLAAVLLIVCLGGCAAKVDTNFPADPAATLGDALVSAESFYYYFANIAFSLESDMNTPIADFIDTAYDEESEDGETYKVICEDYAIDGCLVEAVIEVLFKEAGLTVEPADETSVKAQIQTYITNFGSEAAYEQAIKEAGMSRNFFEASLMSYVKIDKLMESLRGTDGLTDADLFELMEGDFVRVKHILLKATDDDGNAIEKEILQAKADVLMEMLADGADFEGLMVEYGEDPGMDAYLNGYVIDEIVSFDPAFITGAFGLEVGEYTLVDGMHGFHIIKRLPLAEEHLHEYYPDGEGYTVEDMLFYDEANTILVDAISAYRENNAIVKNQEVIDEMVQKYIAENPFEVVTDDGEGE